MATIIKRTKEGEIRYIVRVRDALGKWFPSKTFQRKTDAEKQERVLLALRDVGQNALTPERRNMTFAEYKTKWCSECRSKISVGWKQKQDQMIKDHIIPYLVEKKLSGIRSYDVEAVLSSCKEKGLGEQMLVHIYNILHKMFDDAVNTYELLAKNPVVKRIRPKVHQKERNFLEVSESMTLLKRAKQYPLGTLIWIQLYSGLRPSEVLALKVKDLDFERNQILIRSAYNRSERCIQPYPKQKDWGIAPMPPVLRHHLIAQVKDKNEESFVVESLSGMMITYEAHYTNLKKLCKLVGVKVITPHELRHSATELYYEAGASAEDIRRLLNQKSLSSTQRYMHRTDRRLNSISEKVGLTEFQTTENRPLLRVVS